MMTPRDILNRARWASGDLSELAITVVHRGAPGDARTLSGARIVSVGAAGIELSIDAIDAETMLIPYHRFLTICDAHGTLLWDRHGGGHTLPSDPRPMPVPAADPAAPTPPRPREVLPSFSVVLATDPELVLDGSAGEGGGQMLRTALALSMLTKKPFTIERIRAGRAKPGLMRQHLASVQAAARVANAAIDGAALGSTRLTFRPGTIEGGDLEIEIGSAGSVALVLQTVALPLALCGKESRVRVRGGTHAKWAPIFPFLDEAWLPLVRQAGARISLALSGVGFHPAGGGEVVMTTSPSAQLAPLHVPPTSGALDLSLSAIVSSLPEGIARRELTAVLEALPGERAALHSATVRSPGPGNALWLCARDRQTGVCNVFSGIGEPGRSAEEVGAEVAHAFLVHRASRTSVETHLADQLMLPIAVAGEGSFTCHELSLHSRTNIAVIHAFTGRRLRAWEIAADRYRVALEA